MDYRYKAKKNQPTWMLLIGGLYNPFYFAFFETASHFGALVGLELLRPLEGLHYRFSPAPSSLKTVYSWYFCRYSASFSEHPSTASCSQSQEWSTNVFARHFSTRYPSLELLRLRQFPWKKTLLSDLLNSPHEVQRGPEQTPLLIDDSRLYSDVPLVEVHVPCSHWWPSTCSIQILDISLALVT